MKRLLLDTNIYGKLMLDAGLDRILEAARSRLVVHGFRVVREELRAVPRKMLMNQRNFRIGLLRIYDQLTKKEYPLTPDIMSLARAYYTAYRELGGPKSFQEIGNDFLIVSCASAHAIDIVVSEDKKTMQAAQALKAYAIVNALGHKRMPSFIDYPRFRRWFS